MKLFWNLSRRWSAIPVDRGTELKENKASWMPYKSVLRSISIMYLNLCRPSVIIAGVIKFLQTKDLLGLCHTKLITPIQFPRVVPV